MRAGFLMTTALAGASLLAAATPFSAEAQAVPDAAGAEEPDVIVITAQKREEGLQDVPISVRALAGETLAQLGADSLEDVANLVPSLSIANLSRGGSQVQLRGLGSNVGNVGTVALYNDGVVAPTRIQSAGTFFERDAGLYDIERVEVLRGPQGTLYGEGSFGGVINIISKRPDANQFDASVSAGWSTISEGSSDNYDIAGMVNAPIIEDVLAIRAVAYHNERDGYIDAVDIAPSVLGAFTPPNFTPFPDFATLVAEDANTEEVTGGRILVSLTPNNVFDATLIYKREEADLGIDNTTSPNLIGNFTNFDPELTQALFGPALGGTTDIGSTLESDELIFEANLETPVGLLTAIGGYGEVDTENTAPSTSAYEAFSGEVRLASDAEGRFSWIVGAYYRDTSRDITFAGQEFIEQELSQWSVFGQGYYELTPAVTATVGLRYEEQDNETFDQFNTGQTSSGSFDSIIPKFALDWQVNEDALLYVSAAKGFRAGGNNIDQSLGTDSGFVENFDPDQIWNYEFGAKLGLLDGRVTINSALFYIDWSDIQIDRAIDNAFTPTAGDFQFIIVNGEDAHSVGLETEVFITPNDNWNIVIGGSILEAEFDGGTIDTPVALAVPLEGDTLASTPEYLFNASVERRFSFSWADAYIRGDMSIRGSSFGDVPNTPQPGGDLESGQIELVGLRAGVLRDFWEVQVFANNLFNEDGSTFTFYDGGFGDVQNRIQPRTVGVSLKLRYN